MAKSKSGSSKKRRLKRKLWEQQSGLCFYCRKAVLHPDYGLHLDNSATVDHVIPRFRGGSNHSSNLILACRRCNQNKGSQDFFKFIKLQGLLRKRIKRLRRSRRRRRRRRLARPRARPPRASRPARLRSARPPSARRARPPLAKTTSARGRCKAPPSPFRGAQSKRISCVRRSSEAHAPASNAAASLA